MVPLSRAFHLTLAPAREYRQRVAESARGSWPHALAIPGLLALLLGIVAPIAATGRITLSLLLSGMIYWSFVPVVQFATGTVLIRSAADRPVDLPRGVELLFAAHGPWSMWLIAAAAMMMFTWNQIEVLATALVPMALTARMLSAFGREVLGLSHRSATRRMMIHQALTWVVIVVYVELTTQLFPRIIGSLQR
jgi:hypothetical protein